MQFLPFTLQINRYLAQSFVVLKPNSYLMAISGLRIADSHLNLHEDGSEVEVHFPRLVYLVHPSSVPLMSLCHLFCHFLSSNCYNS